MKLSYWVVSWYESAPGAKPGETDQLEREQRFYTADAPKHFKDAKEEAERSAAELRLKGISCTVGYKP